MSFAEAVAGLLNGDFTRLDPLFLGGKSSDIVKWLDEGRFDGQPEALNEALTCACFDGRTDVAKILLDHGVRPEDGMKSGMNAFHWAANRGNLETVRLLITRGADLEALNCYGGTVLSCTVWSAINEPKPQHLEIIKVLLDAGVNKASVELPTGSDWVDELLH